VYEVASGNGSRLTFHRSGIPVWSPDGSQLATAGEDGSVRIWNAANGELVRKIESNLQVYSLAWAPNSVRIFTGHGDGSLRIWETASGKLLETTTIYPHQPRNEWDPSIEVLAGLSARHQVELVSIGNGTASRETDKLVAELIRRHPDLRLTKIMVSEAGASVVLSAQGAQDDVI
jgi:uncharacterized protein